MAPSAIALQRAAQELRAGRNVVLTGAGGAWIAGAAESLSESGLDQLLRASPAKGAAMAISAERANILHIGPTGHNTVMLPLNQAAFAGREQGIDQIRRLADPLLDLANPLQGPFVRIKAPPPKAAQAALALCKLAGLLPAAVVAPVKGAAKTSLRAAIDDCLRANQGAGAELQKIGEARLPVGGAGKLAEQSRLIAFRPADGGAEHLALIIGAPRFSEPVLTRLHSQCFTGDLLGSLRCDCGEQLQGAIKVIAEAGGGILLYLAQEGRGIGLINKLRAYALQDQGFDTFAANERLGFAADERVFAPAGEMLRQLGVKRVRLLTNNPEKCAALERCGIEVVERLAHRFASNNHNEAYLAAKKRRSGHYL